MSDKKLLFSITKKDFEITFFSGTGKGGQHRNKHQNCVRLKHKETGIITTGQNSRVLNQNKNDAFKRMTNHPEFKKYLKLRIAKEILNKEEIEKEINKKVNDMLDDKYLKVEYGVV
jgi:peptide chain release factor 1